MDKLTIEVNAIGEDAKIENLPLDYLFEQIIAGDGCNEGQVFDYEANDFWYKITKK